MFFITYGVFDILPHSAYYKSVFLHYTKSLQARYRDEIFLHTRPLGIVPEDIRALRR